MGSRLKLFGLKINSVYIKKKKKKKTLAELKVAALAAPPGRTPGSDGIPAELYKVHWDELGPALLELYTSAIASGELPQELTDAIVTLMLKKDSDAELPGSYRPLSLINTDYKILARVLAARLKLVIGAVCGPGQAAYVPLVPQAPWHRRRVRNVCLVRSLRAPARRRRDNGAPNVGLPRNARNVGARAHRCSSGSACAAPLRLPGRQARRLVARALSRHHFRPPAASPSRA